MSNTDQEQKSILVPQHKRLAAGEKITGQSMKSSDSKAKAGGLGSVVAKKNK